MIYRSTGRVAVLAVALCGASRSLFAEHITVQVPSGTKACKSIVVPRKWTVPRPVPDVFLGGFWLDGSSKFEFRRPEGSESEVFVTVFQAAGKQRMYSADQYSIRFSGRVQVRPLTQREWDNGEPVLTFQFPTSDQFHKVPDSFELIYKGKKFEKTGPHWVGFMGGGTTDASRLASDGRFVAVNSWSGVDLPGAPLGEFGGSNVHGKYYVDIYEVESMSKVIQIQGEFHNASPLHFVSASFWLGKRYFVLPLSTNMTKLLFCDVAQLEIKK